jgi:hypothetical protein
MVMATYSRTMTMRAEEGGMHRYIKGDVKKSVIVAGRLVVEDHNTDTATLLRTAREEWDARHPLGPPGYRMRDWTCGSDSGEADGDPPVATYCILCGPRPAEPRSEQELAAMRWREPKAEPPQMLLHPQHMRDLKQPVATEWRLLNQKRQGDGKVGCNLVDCRGHKCPLDRAALGTDVYCGARGARDLDGHAWQHRWPSGKVGEGAPEFRRVEQADPALVGRKTLVAWTEVDGEIVRLPQPSAPPAHVHLRELAIDHPRAANGEGSLSHCQRCHEELPHSVVVAIASGRLDCPSCGWHAGRCEHCRGLLTKRWDSQHGRVVLRCQDCEGAESCD